MAKNKITIMVLLLVCNLSYGVGTQTTRQGCMDTCSGDLQIVFGNEQNRVTNCQACCNSDGSNWLYCVDSN